MVRQMKIRLAEPKDCEDLFNWFNDEQSRQSRINQNTVSYESHCEWFNNSLKNPSRYIYIGEDNAGNKIGVVRLDKVYFGVMEIDINLNPKERGHGYGRQLIKSVCALFPVSFFVAQIKKDNIASLKTFKGAGFFRITNYYINQERILVLGRFH